MPVACNIGILEKVRATFVLGCAGQFFSRGILLYYKHNHLDNIFTCWSWRLRAMSFHCPPLRPGMAVLGMFLLFAGCSSPDNSGESSSEMYAKASDLGRHGQYARAIELYGRGLALESLDPPSDAAVVALVSKRWLEGLTGSYDAALATTEVLEGLEEGTLPDSVRTAVLVDKAGWLGELGRFTEAADALRGVRNPDSAVKMRLAALLLQSGDAKEAEALYRPMTLWRNPPSVRIQAWAGLLRCRVTDPAVVVEDGETVAQKIVAESGRVLRMKGEPAVRARALRAAASSLQLLQRHQRNASFLLFRALSLAEGSGDRLLYQVLRLESNTAIVRKEVPFREVAAYFEEHGLSYARASALFMLSEAGGLTDKERISALEEGFAAAWQSAPPYPSPAMLARENRAALHLNGFLLKNPRIFELFDVAQRMGMMRLGRSLIRGGEEFRLGTGTAPDLETEVRRLLVEISGLLQRKADMVDRAAGIGMNRATDQALNMKRGRLFELLPSVRVREPAIASALALNPVTLRTVQETLGDDQAIVRPIFSDSLAAVMVVGKRDLQIVGSVAAFDSLHTPSIAVAGIRRELAEGPGFSHLKGGEGEWFERALFRPLLTAVQPYSRIVVVADDVLPFHLPLPGAARPEQHRFSYLHSFKEFVIIQTAAALPPGPSRIVFYSAIDHDGPIRHKLFYPHDRVFLVWKHFTMEEQEKLRDEIGAEMQSTVSGALALQKLKEDGDSKWLYLSSYGTD